MKKTVLLLCVCLISSLLQAQNCTMPVNNAFFQKEYNTISSTSNSTSKLYYANNLANTNCLSALQVKQIAQLFYSELDKLEFCKTAYKNTVDKDNFYDVYDAFTSFSTAFKLHDFVTAQKTGNTFMTTTNNAYDYPAYYYPDFTNYYGITGCNYPMDEANFYNSYTSYKYSKISESGKVGQIKDFVNSNCLSTAQIMKLTSVLTMESSRLDVLKTVYLRAYDRGNYGSADQLLPSLSYKNDFNNWLKGNTNTLNSNNSNTISSNNTNNSNTQSSNNTVSSNNTISSNNSLCTVSTTDMTDIRNSINKSAFESDKLTVAKQAISAKKCFSVAQIKEIMQMFSFESNKLIIAKYAYTYCIDRTNYYQVNDVFSFSSSKDDLNNYIKNQGY